MHTACVFACAKPARPSVAALDQDPALHLGALLRDEPQADVAQLQQAVETIELAVRLGARARMRGFGVDSLRTARAVLADGGWME